MNLRLLRRIAFWIAILLPLTVFWFAGEFKFYAQVAWWALTAVLLVRPLASVFPGLKFLRPLVMFRREVGILAGTMVLAHFVGFLMVNGINVFEYIFVARSWSLQSFLGWGLFGLVAAIPLLMTSSKWSMLKLGKWWKVLHKLTYLFFIFGGVHIYLQGEESAIISVVAVVVFKLLAHFKVKLWA